MRNLVLLFLITLLFFSCTIEKRRYFKGYHVENGRMGKWENGRMGKRDPSTGSGTARSTGSGTAPRYISPEARHSVTTPSASSGNARSTGSGTGILRQAQEPEERVQQQTPACETSETSAASPASEAQKPQRGDIIIEGDIVMDDIVMEDDVARGGDAVDAASVIFGVLSIVSFAIALLFFGSAIFAIDSLVMTVLLLIGGAFALGGLVFLGIYALIKRKQSLHGHVVGQTNEPEPSSLKPKRVRNALIPFVISGLFVLLAGLKLGSGQLGLLESIEYLVVFVGYAFLAVLFLIITIVRLVRKRKQSKLVEQPVTPTN
jgi:hypothetical protein